MQVVLVHVRPAAAPGQFLARLGRLLLEEQNERQGDLALAQVPAHGLARGLLRGVVVQGVVHQLEGDAQVQAISQGGLHQGVVSLGQQGAVAAGGLDEKSGLARDDLQVAGQVQVEVEGLVDLQALARGGFHDGLGGQGREPGVLVLGDDLVAQGQEHVAGQDRGGQAEDRVGGGHVAPEFGVVQDVVVQQGGRVQELQGAGQGIALVLGIAQGPGREQGEQRAHPFAAGLEHIVHHGPDHGVQLAGLFKQIAMDFRKFRFQIAKEFVHGGVIAGFQGAWQAPLHE